MLCSAGFHHVLLPYAEAVCDICLIHWWVFVGLVGCALWLFEACWLEVEAW